MIMLVHAVSLPLLLYLHGQPWDGGMVMSRRWSGFGPGLAQVWLTSGRFILDLFHCQLVDLGGGGGGLLYLSQWNSQGKRSRLKNESGKCVIYVITLRPECFFNHDTVCFGSQQKAFWAEFPVAFVFYLNHMLNLLPFLLYKI